MVDQTTSEDGNTPTTRTQRWRRRLLVVAMLIALILFLSGVYVIFFAVRPRQIEAGFTRVGGPTRVETAADAARFWLITPRRVVMTSAIAHAPTVLHATQCAMDEDAPLLFTPQKGTRTSVVADLIARWRLPKRNQTTITNSNSPCPVVYATTPGGLSTFTGNGDVLPPKLPLKPQTKLRKFVVFAASKDPAVPPRSRSGPDTEERDLPDVAVGLALAAHMARDAPELGGVSLVVVPEYLEADPGLENDLEAQRGEVLGGVVLGGEGRISDDTRTLLRQILRRRDQAGILGALQASLGEAGGLIAAILALLGLGAAASVATVGAARSLIIESKMTNVGGESVPVDKQPDHPATSAPEQSRSSAARRNPFAVGNEDEPRVTVYLSGGRKVTGLYQGEETLGDVTFIKLVAAEVAGPDLKGLVTANATLVPVSKIELATTEHQLPKRTQ